MNGMKCTICWEREGRADDPEKLCRRCRLKSDDAKQNPGRGALRRALRKEKHERR